MRDSGRYFLVRMDELADPGSRGFSLAIGVTVHDIFVVRRNNRVYGYFNSCPHTGGPLDWVPDRFLSLDERYIQCATHDALFRLDDGQCVAGPCAGDRLAPVSLQIEAGDVFLLTGTCAGPCGIVR
jgi:nitrite reductase/ring-hydroxylating ferredoxin subunit